MNSTVQLGLGLIGIGRPWGAVDTKVPHERDVMRLLERAVELGITFFDTAPAYGVSEERLGRFLARLRSEDRARLTIATKFGEHWSPSHGSSYVDHSRDGLVRSLDRSLEYLHGRIDLLQIHKASVAVLSEVGVASAIAYAKSLGSIQALGVSASDVETIRLAIARPDFDYIQLPLNVACLTFEEQVQAASRVGKSVVVNRPFNMGRLMATSDECAGTSPHELRVAAFRAVLERMKRGVILTGTKGIPHLEENLHAFREAARLA